MDSITANVMQRVPSSRSLTEVPRGAREDLAEAGDMDSDEVITPISDESLTTDSPRSPAHARFGTALVSTAGGGGADGGAVAFGSGFGRRQLTVHVPSDSGGSGHSSESEGSDPPGRALATGLSPMPGASTSPSAAALNANGAPRQMPNAATRPLHAGSFFSS